MADLAVRATRKIERRLIYPLLLLLFMNSIDRVNISFGALRMNDDIGLNPTQFGLGASLFFCGYILFQIPSVWALKRWGPRLWLMAVVGSWGLCATAMALVRSPTDFFVVRTLLGFAESGFAPGVIFLAATWMPRHRRATAVAIVMMGVPISMIFGGPLCATLMSMANPLGLAGWRWMSLAEGISTVLMAAACLLVFVDNPMDARWLSAEEKAWLAKELEQEDATALSMLPPRLGSLLTSGKLWLSAGLWFSLLAGLYGEIFWLPQIVKQIAGGDALQISLLADIPWIAVCVATIANAKHSDRTQERFWHFGASMGLASIGLALSAWLQHPFPALLAAGLFGLGVGGAQGTYWAIPPLFLGRGNSNKGVALINMAGNSAGMLAPLAIGVMRQATGSFSSPLYGLAAIMVTAAGATILMKTLIATDGNGKKGAEIAPKVISEAQNG